MTARKQRTPTFPLAAPSPLLNPRPRYPLTTKTAAHGEGGWPRREQHQQKEQFRRYRGRRHPVADGLGMVAAGGRVRQNQGGDGGGIAVYDGGNDGGEELQVRA